MKKFFIFIILISINAFPIKRYGYIIVDKKGNENGMECVILKNERSEKYNLKLVKNIQNMEEIKAKILPFNL